ncbi:MAG: bifunctional riboflavin kinase/FAD synthetase [Flavobacteriales bacterium]|nr:bifunctional riboflavin kinase/FAD synthetase [Flavobacteriales bacterium]
MLVYNSFDEFQSLGPAVVTIGTFDGVHLGHRVLLKRLVALARERSGTSLVLSFYPHPRMVLYPDDHGIKLLSTPAEKTNLLSETGIDVLLQVPFSSAFSRMAPVDYVREIIVNQLHTKTLVVGFDHRFGRNREGDIQLLQELSTLYGYTLEEIAPEMIESFKISSTKIRQALRDGQVELAEQLLGYRYGFKGKVVRGEGRGHTIGFPTANLVAEDRDKLIPSRGVYAVRVKFDNQWHNAVMNIGVRPTISQSSVESLEVHIPGFSGDLYGKNLSVEFSVKIRDEQKFGSIDELKERIAADIQSAHVYFENHV